MKLRFECHNAPRRRIKCLIDNAEFKCKTIYNNISYSFVELEEGSHVLTVIKRTWYDSFWCYFNIINPIFYLWQLKFLGRNHLGFDESYAAINIAFSTISDETPNIILNLKQNEHLDPPGAYYTLSCTQYLGLKNVNITKLPMDLKKIKRFKITHILSAVFYTMIMIVLSLLDIVCNKGSVTESLLFLFLCVVFLIIIIFRMSNIKSIYSTLKEHNRF